MGNAIVSFVGDMATHYIILFFFKMGVLSKGLTDSSENCCSRSWEFNSLHFPSLLIIKVFENFWFNFAIMLDHAFVFPIIPYTYNGF